MCQWVWCKIHKQKAKANQNPSQVGCYMFIGLLVGILICADLKGNKLLSVHLHLFRSSQTFTPPLHMYRGSYIVSIQFLFRHNSRVILESHLLPSPGWPGSVTSHISSTASSFFQFVFLFSLSYFILFPFALTLYHSHLSHPPPLFFSPPLLLTFFFLLQLLTHL